MKGFGCFLYLPCAALMMSTVCLCDLFDWHPLDTLVLAIANAPYDACSARGGVIVRFPTFQCAQWPK